MSFSTIVTEGGLLPADILERVQSDANLVGQDPRDFDIGDGRDISDYAAAAWQSLRLRWSNFQSRLQAQTQTSTTTLTRNLWLVPLLHELGFLDITFDKSHKISHMAEDEPNSMRLHLIACTQNLDKSDGGISPHALMQNYLNSSEQVWGLLSNGLRLRLLRDSTRFSRPSYVEFDLEQMFEQQNYYEFVLLYRLVHRSRWPKLGGSSHECLLEQYHQLAINEGSRVRDGLRDGVEAALKALGTGFLQHPANDQLRERLTKGLNEGKESASALTPLGYYRQLLRLVYRLLFLMVAEERGLIASTSSAGSPFASNAQGLSLRKHAAPISIYYEHYSVHRLRRLAEQTRNSSNQYDDLWRALQQTFMLFEGSDPGKASALGVSPLDGDLFGEHALSQLNPLALSNNYLLEAMRSLSLYTDKDSKQQRRVNYGALDVEELGSVYESLLDYRPMVTLEQNRFDLVTGTERKTTGSYYTRPELVQELIKSALEPVMAERIAAAGKSQQARREALLSIKVCDPTCGSGHFLLAAARRLGRELALIDQGDQQPSPSAFREAVREVIQHCIFGVDLNPLAVDLCKLALWLEGHNAGKPLSFLDSHIRQGNGLIGTNLTLIKQGIPDDAYKPVTGDDKEVSKILKKRNQTERKQYLQGVQQHNMFASHTSHMDLHGLATEWTKLNQQADDSVENVRTKRKQFDQLELKLNQQRTYYHLWTAAFFMQQTRELLPLIPTTETIAEFERNPKAIRADLIGQVWQTALENNFFHWELEFPAVFERGEQRGFDVVLGNPPWEKIKLAEKEHFVDVDEIKNAINASKRSQAIEAWRTGTPAQRHRIDEFDRAKHRAEAESKFVRISGRYPLTAVGDVNTYALFAEHSRSIISTSGRAGIIVPTGIATDDSTKDFFGALNQHQQLISLFDIENREKIFATVDSRFKFCLLTIGQTKKLVDFSFFITNVNQLKEDIRRFTLTLDDIILINPNTRTAPTFRTKIDADLVKKIYNNTDILLDENNPQPSSWDISFMRMFDITNDSKFIFNEYNDSLVPLYEGSIVFSYDHRYATYSPEKQDYIDNPNKNCKFTVKSNFFADKSVFLERISRKNYDKKYFFGIRRIASNTNERTIIGSYVPYTAVSYGLYLTFTSQQVLKNICLASTINSLIFDYVARNKLTQPSITYNLLYQIPTLTPESFGEAEINFIVPRVLELVYTAYDLQAFGHDVWNEASGELRDRIRQQRLANHAATKTIASAEIDQAVSNINLFRTDQVPPFIWDEERRARIRAELDALIAKLYGLDRDELRYILDPSDVYGADFPGETFRVLKNREIKEYGEYRTQRLVLAAWDRLAALNWDLSKQPIE